ncbi:MAG: lipase [Verrucomicrobia bacterium 61-8]|nr:alpha/beta hydrolase [Verrucomicrobiota bacterium]OJV20927.1 MAG: lipase [Verrucomicrobia bacterium 61-8]
MRTLLYFSLTLFAIHGGLCEEQSRTASRSEPALSYYAPARLEKADAYQKETCVLDLVYPADKPGFATVIWFHGGGLTGGDREVPKLLQEKGFATAAVGYRLSPKATPDEILQDAAAATAWVLKNIASKGGDPKKVFIAGHSAGGYLAAMIGMDPRWLAAEGVSNKQLAGIIPVSGQVTTHFLVKKVRGDTQPELRPIIDDYAPLYYASKDLPPICLILGDRRIEYKNRVEENDLMAVCLRNLGHPFVEFYEMGGLDHGSVINGACLLIPGFIKRVQDNTPARQTP